MMPSAWASAIADARLQHVIDRERAPAAGLAREQARQILTLEQLHHDVRRAVVERPDIGHPAHVLAAQLRRRTRLAHEPLEHRRLGRGLGQERLERDRLLQVQVASGDDHTHATATDHAVDPVFPRNDLADVHQGTGSW